MRARVPAPPSLRGDELRAFFVRLSESRSLRAIARDQRAGPNPPQGCRLVLLGRERAITVWDSPEDHDRFLTERLAAAYQAVGRSLDEVSRSQFEVDMLVASDLAGMAPKHAAAEG